MKEGIRWLWGWPERRSEHRNSLTLALELWPEPPPQGETPLRYRTENISNKGFCFISGRTFEVGAEFRFRILGPFAAGQTMLDETRGVARCVHIENIPGAEVRRYVVGAAVETATLVRSRMNATDRPPQ